MKLVGVKTMRSLLSCGDDDDSVSCVKNVGCKDERLLVEWVLERNQDGDDWKCGQVLWGHHHHNGRSVGRNVCGPGKWQWSHQGFEKWGQFDCKRGNKVGLSCGEAGSNGHGRWDR